MSFLPMGTVYGTLMNFRGEHEALAAQMHAAPYKAPPEAPVLYIKPANTWSPQGDPIRVPRGIDALEVGASVGMVMGPGCRVAGYLLVNDVSVPHESFYRPPVKSKCRDGFLAVGRAQLAASAEVDPARFELKVSVNGTVRQVVRFAQLVRPAAQLLADVSEFMTLQEGDVLLLGCDWGRPRVRASDRVDIRGGPLGDLSCHFAWEDA